jgi:NAD(P)-dependent dehydrogenase (short-subunit alcohol dehydrogenase family)
MGIASARTLGPRGRIVLADTQEDRLAEVVEDLRSEGIDVVAHRCDVTSPDDVAAAAVKVAELGTFRALIHTAGLSPEMAEGRRVLEVDLLGSVRVTDALLRLVAPGCSAVLVSSIAGYAPIATEIERLLADPMSDSFIDDVERALGRPIDGANGYMIAKRGVMLLAERLAATWGARGARVVSVAPGLIDTAMGRMELERQPVMSAMAKATPVQRSDRPLPGLAEDISALAAFLTSDEASFISGCDIRVDGGLMGAIHSGASLDRE